jgi:hypothetical protein
MTNRFGSFVFVVVSKRDIVLVTDNELEAGMPFSHAVEPFLNPIQNKIEYFKTKFKKIVTNQTEQD